MIQFDPEDAVISWEIVVPQWGSDSSWMLCTTRAEAEAEMAELKERDMQLWMNEVIVVDGWRAIRETRIK